MTHNTILKAALALTLMAGVANWRHSAADIHLPHAAAHRLGTESLRPPLSDRHQRDRQGRPRRRRRPSVAVCQRQRREGDHRSARRQGCPCRGRQHPRSAAGLFSSRASRRSDHRRQRSDRHLLRRADIPAGGFAARSDERRHIRLAFDTLPRRGRRVLRQRMELRRPH